jgi:hypothetical protein
MQREASQTTLENLAQVSFMILNSSPLPLCISGFGFASFGAAARVDDIPLGAIGLGLRKGAITALGFLAWDTRSNTGWQVLPSSLALLLSSYSHGHGEEFSGIAWRSALINARIQGGKASVQHYISVSSCTYVVHEHASMMVHLANRDDALVVMKMPLDQSCQSG